MLLLNHADESSHTVIGHLRHAPARQSARDRSGYRVFADGELGAAHVQAHAALDAGDITRGHRELDAWLASHAGKGSDWAHLHFHAALFELALDDWHRAYRRFRQELLPAAATATDVLTDAPALLWRLALTAPHPVALPWATLRHTALRELPRCRDGFVELHHLLALTGAGDLAGVTRWLESRRRAARSPTGEIVTETVRALRALLLGRYGEAAERLEAVSPTLAVVGGSRGQRELFDQIARRCLEYAAAAGLPPGLAA
jgi:hypothetical protein